MKAEIQKMGTGFRRPPRRPGLPTRRPGESRGLGKRCPLDSGLRRNDEAAGMTKGTGRDRGDEGG